MDYKGYNIAVHELGHNVEQLFSLYEVDHTLLAGVPNTAFTEALAFVFQARDLDAARPPGPDPRPTRLRALNDFWQTCEIAGVALVDMAVWHWMYDHPDATPAELREATVAIAQEVWNQYYAPVLGGKDATLLGDLLAHGRLLPLPARLPARPPDRVPGRGALREVGRPLGAEFERVARYGSVTPDLWMKNATGEPLSAGPLFRAAEAALEAEQEIAGGRELPPPGRVQPRRRR